MNKAELIAQIAKKSSITKIDAERFLNALMAIIKKELVTNGKFKLSGLGSFTVKKRASRTGRNPQTGLAIKIPTRKVVKFLPSKSFSRSNGDDDPGTCGGGPGKI